MRDSKTIHIIGAGPAGLSAAINLAINNYKVIVYEKNADVGMRFSNDFQGLENWSREEDVLTSLRNVSINTDFFYKPFYRGRFQGPFTDMQIKLDKPFFYLIKRGSATDTLDVSLKKQALSLGVKIIFNARKEEKNGDIIATGPKNICAIAVGVIFDTDLEDTAMVILNDTIAPKGYAYLLVAEKKATLATVLYNNFKLANQCLEKSVNKFRDILSFEIKNPKKFGGCGTFFIPKSAINKGKIYVGEAAGFQDFLFGFGIRYAIISGYLSAKSIIEGVDYNTLWKNEFSQQLKASLSNRILYELFGHTGYDILVKKTGISKDPREFWMKLYNNSISRKFIYPFATLCFRLKNFTSKTSSKK